MLRQAPVHQPVLVKRLIRIVGYNFKDDAFITGKYVRTVARLQLLYLRHFVEKCKLILRQAIGALHLQIHQAVLPEKSSGGIEHVRPGRFDSGEKTYAQHNDRKNGDKPGFRMPDLAEDVLP
ncbi:hypothetical protein D3C73_950930 [compost metagenome]